jgi:hypothetical protein
MIEIILFTFLTNFFYYSLGSIVLFKIKNIQYSIFYIALIGAITTSFIALLLNFFTPLNKNINTFLFVLVILIFLIKTKTTIKKKEIFFLINASIISFFLILLNNINRPDAGLYHLPYISILNEYKIIFGLNNLHARFGHASIIQYLSAFNNNYFFKDNGIVIPLASLASFYYIYFANEVLKIYKKKSQINTSSLFSLSVLIYIFFNVINYSNFGNDAIAHLSFFYLISYILKLENKFIDTAFIMLISVFIFLNKSTMIFASIIPIFIIFHKYKLELKKIIIYRNTFPIIFLLLWLIKNIIISGCAIYPITLTCITYLPWLDINATKAFSIESEAWAKAWPENNNPNLTMDIFIDNFNWIVAFSKKHLIYIFKITIPYVCALLFLYFFLINFNNRDNKIAFIKLSKFYWLTIITCLIGTIIFSVKFPLYRYGYSYLISLIILILIYFLKNKIIEKKLIYACKFIFFTSIVIFFGKQAFRIINNYQLSYIYKPWPKIYSFENNYSIITEKLYINDNFTYYFSKNGECMFSVPPCTNYKIKENLVAKQVSGYTFLIYK